MGVRRGELAASARLLCLRPPAAQLLLTLPSPGPLTPRKTAKENLAQTTSTITENLMGISRVMSQQVQQSEEAMQTLGNAGRAGGRSRDPAWGPSRSRDWFCGGWFPGSFVRSPLRWPLSSLRCGDWFRAACELGARPAGRPRPLGAAASESAPALLCFSQLFPDHPGRQRGIQVHVGDHPAGTEAHHQIQSARADGQAAHFPGAGPFPGHGALYREKAALPVSLGAQTASGGPFRSRVRTRRAPGLWPSPPGVQVLSGSAWRRSAGGFAGGCLAKDDRARGPSSTGWLPRGALGAPPLGCDVPPSLPRCGLHARSGGGKRNGGGGGGPGSIPE